MAIIDWPTTRPFQGASLQLDLSTSRSGFAGYYTGNRQTVSHLADRRLATLTLPPCRGADGPARQAFLHGLMSRGDWLRMGVPHQPYPRGDIAGEATVATSAAAGARVLNLAGVRSATNYARFPEDLRNTAEAGVVRPWSQFNDAGNAVQVVPDGSITGPFGSPSPSKLQSGTAGSSVRQIFQPIPQFTDSMVCTFAVRVKAGEVQNLDMFVTTRDGYYPKCRFDLGLGIAYPSSSGPASLLAYGIGSPVNFWWLAFITVNVRVGPSAPLFVFQLADSSGANYNATSGGQGLYLWGAQASPGTAVPEYKAGAELQPGDWLSCGGNLLQVDWPGAVGSATETMAVPLVTPLQRPITAGAAVTWANPTGLWEVDADSLPLNFNPAQVADGFALPLREVFA